MSDYLYSFDVFDTLITRKTATPTGIFALIQKELIINNKFKNIPIYLRENFYTIRIQAEENLRNTNSSVRPFPIEEVTFNSIYDSIANCVNLSNEEKNLLKNLELTTEINNTVPVIKNIDLVKKLVSENKKVILISDMYLSGDNIKDILVNIDPIFKDIKIYASSDFLKTKTTGTLYEIIAQKENITYKNWQHMGDNLTSDIKMAKRYNISTIYYNGTQLNACEKYSLTNKLKDRDYKFQITIGTAKNLRTNVSKNNDMMNLGISLSSPMLFMFTYWIIEQAKKLKINRLYFVARDGYILKEIADLIIKKYGYNIEIKYIYGSRIAWRNATLNTIQDILNCSWFNTYESKTITDLFSNFNINPNNIKQYLPSQYHNFNKNLSAKDIRNILSNIANNPTLSELVINNLKEIKNNLLGYLSQEIDYSDDKFAFIDLRGTGLTANLLGKVMQDLTSTKITFFYFQRGNIINLEELNTEYTKFYQMFYSSNKYYHDIIEILTRAPHGQTLGYKKENNKYIPILESIEGEVIVKYGFFDYLKGVILFANDYLNQIDYYKFNPLFLDLFCDYHDFLTECPDKKTADLIGRIPFTFSGVSNQNNILEYAPKFYKGMKRTNWIVGSHARALNKYKKYSEKKKTKFIHLYLSKRKGIFGLYILGKKIFSINL